MSNLVKIIGNGDYGGKGNWIKIALEEELRIPKTAIITTDVFDAFPFDDEGFCLKVTNEFGAELTDLLHEFEGVPVAIRSSAMGEDSFGFTSAGLYPTHFNYFVNPKKSLNYFRDINLLNVFSGVWDKDAKAYRKKHNLPKPKMAVVVQELVGERDMSLKEYPNAEDDKGGLAPYYAGYLNTMFYKRHILGIVRGLSTKAAQDDDPVFHFSPENGEILDSNPIQNKMDYFSFWKRCINSIPFEFVIKDDVAKIVYKQLVGIAKRFTNAGGIGDEFGIDLEFAYASKELSNLFFIQGRPVRKRSSSLDMPDNIESIVEPESFYGFGLKRFQKIVDLTDTYSAMKDVDFSPLVEFNENNEGYLLILPEGALLNARETTEHYKGIRYHHFYNAGGILVNGEDGSRISGAKHFALICHDSGILFVEGQISEEGKKYLGLKGDDSQNQPRLRTLDREVIMLVDGDMNRSGVYIPK